MKAELFCREHPLPVLTVCGAFLLFGTLALTVIETRGIPDIMSSRITVICEYPGLPAFEMEEMTTIPLEESLTRVEDLESMESAVSAGESRTTLKFTWGADMNKAAVTVREAVDSLYPFMPPGMKKPAVITSLTGESPNMSFAAVPASDPDSFTAAGFNRIVERDLKSRLEEAEGIAQVRIGGLREREIHVNLKTDTLVSRGISFVDAAEKISSFLVNRYAGRIIEGGFSRSLEVSSGIDTTDEIENLQIAPGIRVKDLGSVCEGLGEGESLFLYNGEEALVLNLYSRGDPVRSSREVKKMLPELEMNFPGVKLILLEDEGGRIGRSLSDLYLSLFRGLAAASLVLFLLYRRLKPAVIGACSIPYTVVVSLLFFHLLDISLNSISLYGMIAALGLTADNTIVVIHELQYRRSPFKTAAALISSTVTTAAVFLPPLLIPGPVSVIFKDLVAAVIITLSVSLPAALFMAPAWWNILSSRSIPGGMKDINISAVSRAETFYLNCLSRISGKRKGLLILTLTSIPGIVILSILPVRLFPEMDTTTLRLAVTLSENGGYDRVRDQAAVLSHKLMSAPGNPEVIINSGRGAEGSQLNRLNLDIRYRNPSDSPPLEAVKTCCFDSTGSRDIRTLPPPGSFEKLFPFDRDILIESDSRRILSDFLDRTDLPSSLVLRDDSSITRRIFHADIDRMASLGTTPAAIQHDLKSMIEGVEAGILKQEGNSIKLIVRAEDREGDTSLMPVGSTGIRAGETGFFTHMRQRSLIFRSGGKAVVRIAGPGPGETTASGIQKEWVEDVEEALPAGAAVRRNAEKGNSPVIFLLSLILLFLILGVQANSFSKALLLLSPLVPAFSGALLSLLIFKEELTIYSLTGLLILQGTVVNSGILLIDAIEKDGIRGAAERLKPLAATCLSTVAALTPVLLLSLKEGKGESGTAAALIGGLTCGTAASVFMLPVLYENRGKRAKPDLREENDP